jgi:hypothetical protein
MSQFEKRALSDGVLWSIMFLIVLMRFTAGVEIWGQSLGWEIVEQSSGSLFFTYIAIGVVAAVAQLISYFTFRAFKVDLDIKDERDHLIEKRANSIAYWFILTVTNLLIMHVLLNDIYKAIDREILNFATPTGLVFALLSMLILQEVVRNLAVVAQFRFAAWMP